MIQKVYAPSGKCAGTILWEFKQTKSWNDDWVVKLKEDQRDMSAELAALITTALPKEFGSMGERENVWVTQPVLTLALAALLRSQILRVYQARAASLIPADKKDSVFSYLTGVKFKQSIEGEVETVQNLLEDLQKEKKALIKSWCNREQQLNQLLVYKASLYGDLQGILGKSLPSISQLELACPDQD